MEVEGQWGWRGGGRGSTMPSLEGDPGWGKEHKAPHFHPVNRQEAASGKKPRRSVANVKKSFKSS